MWSVNSGSVILATFGHCSKSYKIQQEIQSCDYETIGNGMNFRNYDLFKEIPFGTIIYPVSNIDITLEVFSDFIPVNI